MRWLKRLFLLGLLAVLAVAGLGAWAWQELQTPFRAWEGEELIVDVRSGQGAGSILNRLESEGVLADSRLARLYLIHVLKDPPLIAGEYRFTEALDVPGVLAKLTRGEIITYPVTLIEGLTREETADTLAAQGFGERDLFLRAANDPSLIADLDPEAEHLEGYLYPDTYHFARGISEAEIVATLVRTFRRRWQRDVEPRLAPNDPRTPREVVVLASIVEKEALLDTERPMIAGVYAHRLRRGIALYADPTVIYAKKLLGTWDGNLRRPDLKLDSPYNTYVYPGLPPGPICSPAVKSLQAAAVPEKTRNLYFVSRNDGSHIFAETLSEHNRNVQVWQKQYWRDRWAAERKQAAESGK